MEKLKAAFRTSLNPLTLYMIYIILTLYYHLEMVLITSIKHGLFLPPPRFVNLVYLRAQF